MIRGKVFLVLLVLAGAAIVLTSCQSAAAPGAIPQSSNQEARIQNPEGTMSAAAPGAPPRSANSVAAPDFSLPALDGQNITLSGLKGRPVMVNFWASWCVPCREEMPLLQAVFEEKQKEGLVLLAVDIGETPEVVRKFVAENKLTFTIPLDRDNRVAATYGIRAIPTTVLVDKNGDITDVKVGAFSSRAEIRNMLKKIMQ